MPYSSWNWRSSLASRSPKSSENIDRGRPVTFSDSFSPSKPASYKSLAMEGALGYVSRYVWTRARRRIGLKGVSVSSVMKMCGISRLSEIETVGVTGPDADWARTFLTFPNGRDGQWGFLERRRNTNRIRAARCPGCGRAPCGPEI